MPDNVHEQLQGVMRQVFGDISLELTPQMTAADVAGWNSLNHLNLMVAVERRFGVRFTNHEMTSLGEAGKNVGDLEALIASKLQDRSK